MPTVLVQKVSLGIFRDTILDSLQVLEIYVVEVNSKRRLGSQSHLPLFSGPLGKILDDASKRHCESGAGQPLQS